MGTQDMQEHENGGASMNIIEIERERERESIQEHKNVKHAGTLEGRA
jgi:hypothetical protein